MAVQVTGIFFESKVDYTTWFGDNVEYIHGLQVNRHILYRTNCCSLFVVHGRIVI